MSRGLGSSPATAKRAEPWPRWVAMCVARGALAIVVVHEAKSDQSQFASMPGSIVPITLRRPAVSPPVGAGVMPQFPTTSVVIPWVTRLVLPGYSSAVRSEWQWMSTNPGDTTSPVQSTVGTPSCVSPAGRISVMVPSRTTIDAVRGAAPLPSTRSPPERMNVWDIRLLLGCHDRSRSAQQNPSWSVRTWLG